MAYYDIAQMSADVDLNSRVAACAAQEGKADPRNWTADNILLLAASPGWSEAWAAARVADPPVELPGADESVITDGMILAAVQGSAA